MRLWSFLKDTGFKLLLLCLGFWEFTPWFPDSLDLLDKIITSLILVYFWFKFGTAQFSFGKKSSWLNAALLMSFYILSIDTFVKFAEQAGSVVVHEGVSAIVLFGVHISTAAVDVLSAYVGISLLIVIALYVALRVPLQKGSFAHAAYHTVFKRGWTSFASTRRSWLLVKFVGCLVVLLFVSQYLFHLVTQWFVVSLDKSLLILAVLFAIKDLEKSKIKAFQTLGNIDDMILGTVRSVFTNTKTFYIGIGFVLMFHVLSDLSVFFLPYLFNLGFEQYYFDVIGNPAAHQTLFTLFSSEQFSAAWVVHYVLSALGVVTLLVLPIMFCFVFGKDIKDLLAHKATQISIIVLLVFVLDFLVIPWVRPKMIARAGMYGVDFVTTRLSEVALLDPLMLISVLGLLFIIGVVLSRILARYAIVLLFFSSFIYLGLYCWTFFRSSIGYYLENMLAVSLLGNAYVPLVFFFLSLAVMDFLFYVGGFAVFTFYASRYIVRWFRNELLRDSVILGAAFLIVALSMLFVWLDLVALVFITVLVGFLFNLAFYWSLTGLKEFRDDLILVVSMIIGLFVVLAAITPVFALRGMSAVLLSGASAMIVCVVAWMLVRFFGLVLSFSRRLIKWHWVALAAIVGVLFGGVFALLQEPLPAMLTHSFYMVGFAAIIAFGEELLFRFVLLRLAEKAFGFSRAVIIQAVLFVAMHVVDLRAWSLGWGFALYLAALFVFAIVAALLVGKSVSRSRYAGNLVYAIVFHAAANSVRFLA